MTDVFFVQFRGRAVQRFAYDRSGNISVLFAIALVPILTSVGAGIDDSRVNAARSSIQAALDSTA